MMGTSKMGEMGEMGREVVFEMCVRCCPNEGVLDLGGCGDASVRASVRVS
jgi:hypothetical protein